MFLPIISRILQIHDLFNTGIIKEILCNLFVKEIDFKAILINDNVQINYYI